MIYVFMDNKGQFEYTPVEQRNIHLHVKGINFFCLQNNQTEVYSVSNPHATAIKRFV